MAWTNPKTGRTRRTRGEVLWLSLVIAWHDCFTGLVLLGVVVAAAVGLLLVVL